MRGKTAYGLTFPLLLDGSGKKFGKSEGNAMFMSADKTSIYDWYQFFLRSDDSDVIRYLKVFSLRPLSEIADLEAQMKAHPEARIDVSGKSADELETIFKDVKSAALPKADIVGKPVFAVAAAAGMFKSNGEARRMAQQGGLSINGAKAGPDRIFAETDLVDGRVAVLRSGKKNHFLLKLA